MKKVKDSKNNNYNKFLCFENMSKSEKIHFILDKTVSTKNIYLLAIILISLFSLISYVSFAYFTVAKEKKNAFKIVVGNLVSNISSEQLDENNSITIKGNTKKIIEISIDNTNSINAKYNLNYSVYNTTNTLTNNSVDVKYVETSKNKPNEIGQFVIKKATDENHTAKIKVILINKTTEKMKVVFDSQVGLETATLTNKNNVRLVSEEFKYTYDSYTNNIATLPYAEGDVEEAEYKVKYIANPEESLYVKLSKNKVYMDVTETLENQNLEVRYKSSYQNEIYIEHPQSELSTNNNSFSTNIRDYVTYNYPTISITKVGGLNYTDTLSNYPFRIIGNIKDQTTTLNGENITVGFYGYYNNNTNATYDNTKFELDTTMPSFKLYTYNKTKLKEEIEKAKKNIYNYDPEYYEIDAYINKINDAINNYYNKRKVTQEQLDSVILDLKKGPKIFTKTIAELGITIDYGTIDSTTGENKTSSSNRIRTSLYAPVVINNITITADADVNYAILNIYSYDENKQYLGRTQFPNSQKSQTFDLEPNAKYMRFVITYSNGVTLENFDASKIKISYN